jgi:hypothetical protein
MSDALPSTALNLAPGFSIELGYLVGYQSDNRHLGRRKANHETSWHG